MLDLVLNTRDFSSPPAQAALYQQRDTDFQKAWALRRTILAEAFRLLASLVLPEGTGLGYSSSSPVTLRGSLVKHFRIPRKELDAIMGGAMAAMRELADFAKQAKSRLRDNRPIVQDNLAELLRMLVAAQKSPSVNCRHLRPRLTQDQDEGLEDVLLDIDIVVVVRWEGSSFLTHARSDAFPLACWRFDRALNRVRFEIFIGQDSSNGNEENGLAK
jgi:hypothetical protein